MSGATVLLAALLGYRFGGLDWMCLAAGAAWATCAVASMARWRAADASQINATDRIVGSVEDIRTDITQAFSKLADRLPKTREFYSAVLDSLPPSNYALLAVKGMKSQEDHEADAPHIWGALRRRLVGCFGMTATYVDNAKGDILNQFYTGNPLPETDQQLIEMVAQWREPLPTTPEEWASVAAEQMQIMRQASEQEKRSRPGAA